MATTYSLMTAVGRNKEAASLANGTALVLTEIAFGDGARIPNGGELSLENEVARKPISAQGLVEGNLNASFFDASLDAEDGPYVIREGGVFDQDGDMIAVIKYDPPINKPIAESGQAAVVTIRTVVAFSDLQNLILKINAVNAYVAAERRIDTEDGVDGGGDFSADRTFKLAVQNLAEAAGETVKDEADNRDWFVFHDSSAGVHKRISASEMALALGVHAKIDAAIAELPADQLLELASPEETITGENETKATHSAGVKAAIDAARAEQPLFFYGLG